MNRKALLGMIIMAMAAPGAAREGTPPAIAHPPTPSSRCIDSYQIVSRPAVAPYTIAYTLTGGRTFRSRIGPSCAHLADLDRTYVLVLKEQQGRKICGGDRSRLVDPVAARSVAAAAVPFAGSGHSSG